MVTAGATAGHLGWAFAGPSAFAGRVAGFLAEGMRRHERLMVVVDDPRLGQWPERLIETGQLQVLSTAEVYGADAAPAPDALRAGFLEAVTEATRLGYAGLRVAADNTTLTIGPDRLAAWLRWEAEADALMKVAPITGLCAFDTTRIDQTALAALMDLHPATPFPDSLTQ